MEKVLNRFDKIEEKLESSLKITNWVIGIAFGALTVLLTILGIITTLK